MSDRLSSLSEALACDSDLAVIATDSLCCQYVVYPSIKWTVRPHLRGAVLGLNGQDEKPWKAIACIWFTDALKALVCKALIQHTVLALNLYLYYMTSKILIVHITSVFWSKRRLSCLNQLSNWSQNIGTGKCLKTRWERLELTWKGQVYKNIKFTWRASAGRK